MILTWKFLGGLIEIDDLISYNNWWNKLMWNSGESLLILNYNHTYNIMLKMDDNYIEVRNQI